MSVSTFISVEVLIVKNELNSVKNKNTINAVLIIETNFKIFIFYYIIKNRQNVKYFKVKMMKFLYLKLQIVWAHLNL